MTLSQVLAAEPVINDLAKVKRSAKDRYHLARLVEAVRRETKHFADERVDLIKTLGQARDPTPTERAAGQLGVIYEVKPEHLTTYIEKLNELLAVDVEIDARWLLTPELLAQELLSAEDELALEPLFRAAVEG